MESPAFPRVSAEVPSTETAKGTSPSRMGVRSTVTSISSSGITADESGSWPASGAERFATASARAKPARTT